MISPIVVVVVGLVVVVVVVGLVIDQCNSIYKLLLNYKLINCSKLCTNCEQNEKKKRKENEKNIH